MIFVQNSSPKRPWSKQSGRPRPSTTATPRKSALRSHSAFIPFARYSDRLLEDGLHRPIVDETRLTGIYDFKIGARRRPLRNFSACWTISWVLS